MGFVIHRLSSDASLRGLSRQAQKSRQDQMQDRVSAWMYLGAIEI